MHGGMSMWEHINDNDTAEFNLKHVETLWERRENCWVWRRSPAWCAHKDICAGLRVIGLQTDKIFYLIKSTIIALICRRCFAAFFCFCISIYSNYCVTPCLITKWVMSTVRSFLFQLKTLWYLRHKDCLYMPAVSKLNLYNFRLVKHCWMVFMTQ